MDGAVLKNAFTEGVLSAWAIGNRIRKQSLFREGQVREYKRKAREEALRHVPKRRPSGVAAAAAPGTSPTSNGVAHSVDVSAGTNGVSGSVAAKGGGPVGDSTAARQCIFLDVTQVKPELGSTSDEFYNKWPRTVRLESGEDCVEWSYNLDGKHCPFCEPRGKCSTLKEFVDHLDTHHEHFLWRPRRQGNVAVISMKVRPRAKADVDPMYVVKAEGIMMSARMRLKEPGYAPVAKPRSESFPFVVIQPKIPESYGGYIAGAPGTVDVNGGSMRRLSIGADITNVALPKTKVVDASAVASGSSSKTSRKRPAPSAAESRNASTPKKTSSSNATTTKKYLRNDPSGMDNEMTRQLRKTLITDGEISEMTIEAAGGNLFHTLTNVPLNVDKYNEGYDSDDEQAGSEAWWRLRVADDQLADVADMIPIEKYFFGLWNQFISLEFVHRNDRGVLPALRQFVEKYGGEIKRMNCESVLVSCLRNCWSQGTLDADGVLHILSAFSILTSKVPSGAPHPEFAMAHRLLRESRDPLHKEFTYDGIQDPESFSLVSDLDWNAEIDDSHN